MPSTAGSAISASIRAASVFQSGSARSLLSMLAICSA